MVSLEIETNQAGQRLDKFLGKYLPGAPSGFFYKMLRKKNITLNGKKAEGREILQLRDQVTLWLADETILKFGGYLPERNERAGEAAAQTNGIDADISAAQTAQVQMDRPVDPDREDVYRRAYRQLRGVSVLYEDAHVLILDKPAGVLTQQAKAGDLSLNEWMIGYLLDTGSISSQQLRLFKPSVCNRLDRNTSGLVLCGKSLPGSQTLSELIRSRGVRKFYRTVCVGLPKAGDMGEIQGYLQKDSRTNRVIVSSRGSGDYICTVCRPLGQYFIPAKELSFTEMEVELITGKTHQIRAHLASTGHPLVGDHKYGNARVNRLFQLQFGLRWQLLHAYRLEFPALRGALAPLGSKSIQAPLPACYESILAGLEALGGEK